MENASKIFYGALSLLILAALVLGTRSAGSEGLAFAFFSVLIVGGGLMCVWERSVIRSAFCLMAVFGGVAGLFVLLEADFLAMAQLLIYVGAILALILFAVMMTPPDLTERKISRVLGALLLVGGAVTWVGVKVAATLSWGEFRELEPAAFDNAERVGVAFLAPEQYVLPFELAAVLLTVALVAAVYVARRKRSDVEPPPEGDGSAGAKGELS